MKTILLASMLIAASSATLAAEPACTAPKDKWMNVDTFKKGVESQGYKIKTFKITKGNCYEIYGFDKAGKKVEINFDPVTAAVLSSE